MWIGAAAMDTLVSNLKHAAAMLRRGAPYLLMELLLPGGTLFALLLLVYERREAFAIVPPRPARVIAAHAAVMPRSALAPVASADGSTWIWRGGAVEMHALARAA
jgi:hypothetical protein